MLVKTFAYEIVKCLECEKWIIYKSADGMPGTCPRCGIPSHYHPTAEEKRNIERMQEQNRGGMGGQGGVHNGMHFVRFN